MSGPHVIHHGGDEKPVDPGFQEISRGEVSVAFVKVTAEGTVEDIDIYVLPREKFEEIPEWENVSTFRKVCEAYRTIPLDTVVYEREKE